MDQPLTDLTLHRMSRQHLDSVLRIERQVYPFPWTHGNFADSLKAGYEGSVVFEPANPPGGELIGYAVVMHILDEAHLLNLSIAANYQGAGMGRRLLRRLIGKACSSGSRGMFLEVRPSNEVALRLYESERFLRVGLRRNYYPSYGSSREDAIVMRRALDTA